MEDFEYKKTQMEPNNNRNRQRIPIIKDGANTYLKS
jgi:hypothetical protein